MAIHNASVAELLNGWTSETWSSHTWANAGGYADASTDITLGSSITESVTASDATTEIATLSAIRLESLVASDAAGAAKSSSSVALETISSVDAVSAARATAAAIIASEVAASDIFVTTASRTAVAVEASTAFEITSGISGLLAAVIDAVSVMDAVNAGSARQVAASELVSAQDVASETKSATVSVTEVVAALDAWFALVAATGVAVEVVAAQDAEVGVTWVAATILVNSSASDVVQGAAFFDASQSETVAAIETLIPGIPQMMRPIADVSPGAWTPSTGSDLYAMVDEPDPGDSDYIRSLSRSTCEVKLQAAGAPRPIGDHVLRYRLLAGSGTVIVYLKQGSTTIASWSHPLTEIPQDSTHVLSTLVKDTITDYADLRVAFEAA